MIYFTADWHLNHSRILTYCSRTEFMSRRELDLYLDTLDEYHNGDCDYNEVRNLKYSQETVQRMNNTIIDDCNKVVKKDDILYMLGDMGLTLLNEFRPRINCKRIYLIRGNHDKKINNHLFNGVYDSLTTDYNGQKIFLSHYPHLSWPKKNSGVWHLYGHSHGEMEWVRSKYLYKMMDVGIDYRHLIKNNWRPWSFDEIKIEMEKMEKNNVD